jgi:hypothetical protein
MNGARAGFRLRIRAEWLLPSPSNAKNHWHVYFYTFVSAHICYMLSFLTLHNNLPEHLTPRATSESLLVLSLFVACIFLIAIARYREKHIFLYLLQAVFFLKPLDDLSKDAYKMRSTASVLFILQFLLITAGAIYWLFFRSERVNSFVQLMPLLVPGCYLLYQFMMTNIAARIGGDRTAVQELNYFTVLLSQFFGLIFLVELFVSYFQPGLTEKSKWLLAVTYIAYLLIRFLRGVWIVMNQGVAWYYIILYFWTLEILPLLVVVKLLYDEEFQILIG